MDEMNARQEAHADEPTANYNQTTIFRSIQFQRFSIFQLIVSVLVHFHAHQSCFQMFLAVLGERKSFQTLLNITSTAPNSIQSFFT